MELFHSIRAFLITHQWIALGVLAGLVLFLWKKPKAFFQFIVILLGLSVAMYVFSYLNESAFVGFEKKHEITTEREKRLSVE